MRNLIDRLGAKLFGSTPPPAPQPELNRKQRRELDKIKPGELRMRRERTFAMQAARRSSSKGDHGAKAKRAYKEGVRWGLTFTIQKAQQAYFLGLKEGRSQRIREWFRKPKQLIPA